MSGLQPEPLSVSYSRFCPEFPFFGVLHSFLHNSFIRFPNHAILVSMKSPRSLKSVHFNEGTIEEHHLGEMIICFPRLHDDFVDFSSISLVSIVGLITKLGKYSIRTLIYIIKLIKPKQNMGIK